MKKNVLKRPASKSSKFLFCLLSSVAVSMGMMGALSAPARANSYVESEDCYSGDELKIWKAEYDGLGVDIFSTVCRPSAGDSAKIFDTLHFLNQIEFKTTNQTDATLGAPAITQSWPDYLSSRVDGFTLESSCDKNLLAYAPLLVKSGAHSTEKKIHVCPLFQNQTDYDAIYGIASFMAAARRIEFQVPNVVCKQGANKGAGICDQNTKSNGINKVSLEVFAKVAGAATNIHPTLRLNARNQAISIALNNFNEPPKILRSQIPLFLTVSGNLVIDTPSFNRELGKGFVVGPFTQDFDGKLVIFSDWPDDRFMHLSVNGWLGWVDINPNQIESDYIKMGSDERARVTSAHFGNPISALVSSDAAQIFCRRKNEDAGLGIHQTTVTPQPAVFGRIVYPNGYSASATTLTLQGEDGRWTDISCDPQGNVKVAAWRPATYGNSKKVMKINGQNYILTNGGQVFRESVVKGVSKFYREDSMNDEIYDLFQYDWIQFIDGE